MIEADFRRDAAQATLDEWTKRPFRMGRSDCARRVAAHLRRMGQKVKLPPAGSYASVRSALVQLRARGFADLLEAMDGMGFARIAPAAALPGDVVALPSENPIGCLTVAVGNGRVCGYHPDSPVGAVLQPVEFVTAWRIGVVSQ